MRIVNTDPLSAEPEACRFADPGIGSKYLRDRLLAGTAIAGMMFAASSAFAGGFYAPYQSATANATAIAGATAGTGDPSGLFFNPAANASLQGHQIYIDTKVFPT